jgi:hypothetical protein
MKQLVRVEVAPVDQVIHALLLRVAKPAIDRAERAGIRGIDEALRVHVARPAAARLEKFARGAAR